ncbi:MAG: hypothetical protein KAW91_05760 [candidate division Zixibacteria bacterium]|nr:hypothetical protein [candidate division Zixibacteria bacterium]
MAGWNLEYGIDVDLSNRIVYEKIYGVWRVETAESYKKDFQEEVVDLIKKPWAKLIDLSNWKIGYPEIVEIVGKHLEWCHEHNMVWSVNVINNPPTYRQLHQMFARGGTKSVSKTFRTRVEAEAFLMQEGFTVRSANGLIRRPSPL